MTQSTSRILSIPLVTACLLTACGGGGSLNDGQTPLRTEGQSITLQSAINSCPATPNGVTVFIFGGTPPYTLRNTVPQQVALSTDSVGNAGEGFNVRFLGGCLSNVPLVVVDKTGTTVSVPLNYAPGTN